VKEDMHSWDKWIILDSNFPGNSKKLCILSLQLWLFLLVLLI